MRSESVLVDGERSDDAERFIERAALVVAVFATAMSAALVWKLLRLAEARR